MFVHDLVHHLDALTAENQPLTAQEGALILRAAAE